MKKVVLAYSGGLDTSCAIPWLKEKGYEVVAVIGDVGQGEDFEKIRTRALKTGASKAFVLDLKKEFVEDYVFAALKAGAIYERKYFLATSLSRPIIAKYQVEVAHKEKAGTLAHGCTGKGNDQVRFEVTAKLLDPKLDTIAPVRIWKFKTRDEEIDYLTSQGISIEVTKKKPYSIDKNIFGMSIEAGILEDPWIEPPEDIYQMTVSPEKAPAHATYLDIEFRKGIPVKLNGKLYDPVALLKKLNEVGGKNGIGRVDMVENRLVGIKSREIYECPSGTILHTAHQELEALVLDRETMRFKQSVSLKYADLVYYGLWETPLKKQLDAYIEETQKHMTGTIRLKLYKGNCTVAGRRSAYSRYKEELATYGEKDKFDQKLAEGFIKIWGMPY